MAAESARCIAAAEGCVDMGVVKDCGRLSFRIGELFRDVCGLEPADGDDRGTRLLDGCFRNVGGAGVDCDESCRC